MTDQQPHGSGRTLYVTDLDGTLLGEGGVLSSASRALLEPALAASLDLTVATARSSGTALRALEGLQLPLPVVVYSGASAIEPDGSTAWWHLLDGRVAHPLVGAALAAGVTPLVFWLDGERERISWVRGAETVGVEAFAAEREGDPRLAPVDGWDEVDLARVFFVSLVGEHVVLRRLARMVRAISWGTGCSLALEPHRDGSGMAVLDITSDGATKGSGVQRIARDGGFERIVALGDGTNDLPMFAIADESYATAHASDAVKAAATGVLPAEPDAVARFLAERAGVREAV